MTQKIGWISIHRKLMEKGYYKDSEYIHLWIHLLLSANRKKNEFLFSNRIINVSRGSLITSRKQLALATSINESKIERILKCLKSEQQIEQLSFSSHRLITIVNYNKYQPNEQQTEHEMNSQRTASEQLVNTNNKFNKGNKDNNIYTVFDFWNNQKLTIHKKLDEDLEKVITKGLSKYNVEEIKKGIKTYCDTVKSPDTFFKYKWTLKEFLSRSNGVSVWKDKDISNYIRSSFLPKEIAPLQQKINDFEKTAGRKASPKEVENIRLSL